MIEKREVGVCGYIRERSRNLRNSKGRSLQIRVAVVSTELPENGMRSDWSEAEKRWMDDRMEWCGWMVKRSRRSNQEESCREDKSSRNVIEI